MSLCNYCWLIAPLEAEISLPLGYIEKLIIVSALWYGCPDYRYGVQSVVTAVVYP